MPEVKVDTSLTPQRSSVNMASTRSPQQAAREETSSMGLLGGVADSFLRFAGVLNAERRKDERLEDATKEAQLIMTTLQGVRSDYHSGAFEVAMEEMSPKAQKAFLIEEATNRVGGLDLKYSGSNIFGYVDRFRQELDQYFDERYMSVDGMAIAVSVDDHTGNVRTKILEGANAVTSQRYINMLKKNMIEEMPWLLEGKEGINLSNFTESDVFQAYAETKEELFALSLQSAQAGLRKKQLDTQGAALRLQGDALSLRGKDAEVQFNLLADKIWEGPGKALYLNALEQVKNGSMSGETAAANLRIWFLNQFSESNANTLLTEDQIVSVNTQVGKDKIQKQLTEFIGPYIDMLSSLDAKTLKEREADLGNASLDILSNEFVLNLPEELQTKFIASVVESKVFDLVGEQMPRSQQQRLLDSYINAFSSQEKNHSLSPEAFKKLPETAQNRTLHDSLKTLEEAVNGRSLSGGITPQKANELLNIFLNDPDFEGIRNDNPAFVDKVRELIEKFNKG